MQGHGDIPAGCVGVQGRAEQSRALPGHQAPAVGEEKEQALREPGSQTLPGIPQLLLALLCSVLDPGEGAACGGSLPALIKPCLPTPVVSITNYN